MVLTAELRTPYRSIGILPSGAAGVVDEAGLARAIGLTQLVLWALCAARVGVDVFRGFPTIEGGIALALLFPLTRSLVLNPMDGRLAGWLRRRVGSTGMK